MISATIETGPLVRFQRQLAIYHQSTGKTIDEVLEKKGRDLGIRLYQGFRGRKWGGPGKSPKLATAELAARTAAGRGTRVRKTLRAEYLQKRSALRSEIRDFIGPKTGRQQTRDIKRRIALWQEYVGREIGLRQQGIGVLSASFLWYRSRHSQARGTYYVRNRTGHSLGFVQKGEGFLRITGLAAGLTEVDARYSIVAGALTGATDDMRQHLLDKQIKEAGRILGLNAA